MKEANTFHNVVFPASRADTQHLEVEFHTVNVLENPEIREGVKHSVNGQPSPNFTSIKILSVVTT